MNHITFGRWSLYQHEIRKPGQGAFYGHAGHVCWATEAKLPRKPRGRPSQGARRHIGWVSEFWVHLGSFDTDSNYCLLVTPTAIPKAP